MEKHPLEPFLPESAKVLMLGTFPPKKERWSMNFYYPNFQNDMWRIMGYIFYADKNYFIDVTGRKFDETKVRLFCRERGIALSDTAQEAVRLKDNASDKFLEITRPVDLGGLLEQLPDCGIIVTTGQKATDTLLSLIDCAEPGVGESSEFVFLDRAMKLFRMPSSSRAYPRPIEVKAEFYSKVFVAADML